MYTGDRLANVNSDEELEALYNEEVTKAKEHFHKAGRVHKYGSTVIWRFVAYTSINDIVDNDLAVLSLSENMHIHVSLLKQE